jgi:hypothetical protein
MLDVTDLKRPKKNSRTPIKRWRRLLMLLDLMLEVGLDGTIYNYHSHRKDSFWNLQIGLLENFRVLPADAANLAFSAIREAAEMVFNRSIHLRKEK